MHNMQLCVVLKKVFHAYLPSLKSVEFYYWPAISTFMSAFKSKH